jgi:glycosyltransferase involved in cell wall biosynthesis
VTTIHDISPVTHPEWFSRPYAALYRMMTPLAVRRSDRIITVSEFARDELIDRYPSANGKTTAIYNGVADRSECAATRPSVIDSDGYLLFVGSSNPRKNLRRLLQAYDRYRQSGGDSRELVLVGPDRDVFSDSDLPTVDGVRNLGFVNETELTWLYRNASLFLFPSLYEGFGLPILEAMSAGTPVLTASVGATAEIAGDAAYLVDPTSVSSIADGIQTLLLNEQDREALIRLGKQRAAEFTWKRTAQQTIDVYREVANENK